MLGADSTSTLSTDDGLHFFNHGQKLLEIGESGRLGAVTWGMGGLATKSHRTIIAELGDDLQASPPADVSDVATRFANRFWAEYQGSSFQPDIQKCASLGKKPAYDPSNASPDPSARTEAEEKEFNNLKEILTVGFCIAGYVLPNRTPEAFQIVFEPTLPSVPAITALPMGPGFWGAPIMILRLLLGYDVRLKDSIFASPHWGGTLADLEDILGKMSFHTALCRLGTRLTLYIRRFSALLRHLSFQT